MPSRFLRYLFDPVWVAGPAPVDEARAAAALYDPAERHVHRKPITLPVRATPSGEVIEDDPQTAT